ncbi:MAG: hypothetical protein Q8R28_05785 [Dehalococcoidia bacterium]|nr:hypothetical protein [Dehalococcoidia bacterium]
MPEVVRTEWRALDEDLQQTITTLLITYLDGKEMEATGKEQKDEAGVALRRLFEGESALAEGVVAPDPAGTDRTYNLKVQPVPARLNEELLRQVLLERGVDPVIVDGAFEDSKKASDKKFMGVYEGRGKTR